MPAALKLARRSPLVLWGTSEASRKIAQRLAAALAEGASPMGLTRLFEPDERPLPALRELLGQLAEAARTLGLPPDIEVKVLIAAWQGDIEAQVQILSDVSRTLGAVLPGNQSLTVTVLLPPPLADDSEKRRVAELFTLVEELLGTLPFLDTVFVYQVPIDVYRQGPEAEAGSDELAAVIVRECGDMELAEVVRRIGFRATRAQRVVAGHKASYSALGCRRLVYPRGAALEHLKSRFAYELFRSGLDNPNGLSQDRRTRLERQARDFVEGHRPGIEEQFRFIPPVNAAPPEATAGPDQQEALRTAFEQVFSTAETDLLAQLQPFLEGSKQGLRAEFDAVLATAPGHLTGGRYYLELLGVTLDELQRELCLAWAEEGLAAYFDEPIKDLSWRFRFLVPPASGTAAPIERVRAAREAFARGLRAPDTPAASPVQFFVASWDLIGAYLDRQSPAVSDARQLVTDICTLFRGEALKLHDLLQQNQQWREEILRELGDLRGRFRWYQRLLLRRRAYLTERQTLRSRLAALAEECERYQLAHSLTRTFFWRLLDNLLWPLLARTTVLAEYRARLDALREEFAAFAENVEKACKDRAHGRENVPQVERHTETTVVDASRLDVLYHKTVGAAAWAALAADALACVPATLDHPSSEAASGRNCKTLREHFHAGPESLVQRLAEFAADRFASAQALDALDIIECSGPESARALLDKVFAKTVLEPDLSPGMMSVAQAQGVMQRVVAVRTSPFIRDRLRERYGHLFTPNDQFLVGEDPDVIDITTFTFGFPACALHLVHQTPLAAEEPPASKDRVSPSEAR